MLLRHWTKARHLIAAVHRYVATKQAFEVYSSYRSADVLLLACSLRVVISICSSLWQASYELSLNLVKKAELASRGYRIGLMLPPVGRIERVTSMKCAQLRLRLRRINDAMEDASVRLKNRQPLVGFTADADAQEMCPEQDDATGQRAPSLLISALSKRHELANVLLESALHGSLFDCVSLYWNLVRDEEGENLPKKKQPGDRSKASQVAAFETLRSQFEELVRMFLAWNRELDQLNNSSSVKVLRGDSVESSRAGAEKAVGGGRPYPQESAGEPDNEDIEALSVHLHELRTTCETLKHLVFAAQQDVSMVLQSPFSPVSRLYKEQQLSQSLMETRGIMQNMVGSLHNTWTLYEKGLDALASAGKGDADIDSSANCADGEIAGADADNDDDSARLKTLEEEEARLREEQERSKFTFVFTGTSTGERDFDLKAILETQEQQQKALPAPYFVRELQVSTRFRFLLGAAGAGVSSSAY